MNATLTPKSAPTRPATRKQAAPPVKRSAVRPATAKPPARAKSKTAVKPATKPVIKRATSTPASDKETASVKPRKAKLVRDSFTIPKDEYLAIDVLKQRAAQAGRTVKKSELLRAGLMALTAMESARFVAAIAAVPLIKTGRPKAA